MQGQSDNRTIIIDTTNDFGKGYRGYTLYSPTLRSERDGLMKMETNEMTLTCASRKRGDTHKIEVGGERANALTSINTDSMVCKTGPKFRIRKLTPRECFRLMDVRDSDIDKIQAAGISNSQQYKMAGNSIVVGVLECIFDKMFIHTKPEAGTQLELF